MRLVLDSNVVIAAFAARGLCNALLEACIANHEIVLCEGILGEISDKLRSRIQLPATVTRQALTLLRAHGTCVSPEPVEPGTCRDPKDLMVLGAALAGGADCIVTGDHDLLAVGVFRGIEIIGPRTFWDRLRQEPSGGRP